MERKTDRRAWRRYYNRSRDRRSRLMVRTRLCVAAVEERRAAFTLCFRTQH